MYYVKKIFPVFLLLLLGACGAQGPIKVYDEKATSDLTNISIIYLPPEIELVEADGMAFDTPYIETGLNEIHLLPGHHELALKYEKYWGTPPSGSLASTKPVVVSFELTKKSGYYLKYSKPEDQWAALAMMDKFSPWLEDKNGVKLKVAVTHAGGTSLTNVNKTVTARQFVEGNNPLEKLKFWWKNSSREEQEAFKKWLEE